ncbi:segregation and condensation protein A [Bradymonas sediminis]|uniref:Segregation and condensation protein A n=1 Tax=Bradymonas sediminis TaxID=1548548 RepID=A0A2Z4FP00_9DELT|nr:segregation/condensation protein A [Bradymonas sediminis]AWV90727.1 segregation/condensation protein A [Bradymonas sediminis]TDP62631.1 condensin subunit ScpA [Bradymonas sediminis]
MARDAKKSKKAAPKGGTPDASSPGPLAVRVDAFEGPMDLLLELIKKHEVDIFDIPIALITEEYLRVINHLESLDLQLGGEWLEMAADLIYIKSKMLLPVEESDEEEDGPDPRSELVRRLIEYQRFKILASKIDALPKLEHDVFLHRANPEDYRDTGPPLLQEVGISSLVNALKRLAKKQGTDANWVVEMTREKLTLRSVMVDVATLLQERPRVTFEELFVRPDGQMQDFSRYRVVTVFLALLEMTKRKIVKLMQSRIDGDQLYIERAVINIVEVSQTLDLPDTVVAG